MEHIDIYNRLEKIEDSIIEYYKNCNIDPRSCNSVDALLFTVVDSIMETLSHNLSIIENDETICMSCFYYNLDKIRKTILRYTSIETEKDETLWRLFKQATNTINLICLDIKHGKDEPCTKVKNTAYEHFDDEDNE